MKRPRIVWGETKKKSSRKPKRAEYAPTFWAAHFTVVAVVLVTALATTVNALYAIDLIGLSMPQDALLKAIAGAFAFGIAMIPILSAQAYAMAKPEQKIPGMIMLGAVMFCDAISMTFTVVNLEEAIRVARYADKTWTPDAAFHWAMILPVMLAITLTLFFFRGWLTMVQMERDEELLQQRRIDRLPASEKAKLELVKNA